MGYTAARHFVDTHDDFPNDENARNALQARVVGLIRADKFGGDISETMELAYSQLVAEGIITPVRDETPEPPPVLSGSGGGTGLPDPDSMSDKELERYLRQAGMLR